MADTSLTLFIDLESDSKIGLRSAANAALAWADMLEDVGAYFDPHNTPIIDLVEAEPGSQKLKALIRSHSADPRTDLRTVIVSSITFLLLTTASWSWEQVLEWMKGPDAPPEVQSLSDDERAAIAQEVVDALEAKIGTDRAAKVYSELGTDQHVTGVGMTGGATGRPSVIVPRNHFPPEVFIVDEEGFEKRRRTEEADLVLLRAVLTRETNKRWGFAWEHGKLGASIKDEAFLERLARRELDVPMSEGIVFRVELEIVEERRDGVWIAKEHSILKVIEVRPPPHQDRLNLQNP